MKLSDIMSAAGLELYAEVALVIFLVVWLAATIRTFARGSSAQYDAAGRMPFDDGPSSTTTTTSPLRGEE